jgi:hypothetical protein
MFYLRAGKGRVGTWIDGWSTFISASELKHDAQDQLSHTPQCHSTKLARLQTGLGTLAPIRINVDALILFIHLLQRC